MGTSASRTQLVDVHHRGARDYLGRMGLHQARVDAHHYPPGHPRHGDPGPPFLLSGRVSCLWGIWRVELGRGVAARGGGVTRGTDVVGAHGLQMGHGGTRAHSPVVQAPDGHHGRARYGPAPLAPLAVRGAHASAVGALQAEGGSGAPEAGEGADPWAMWGGVSVTGGAGVGAQRGGWCAVVFFAEIRVLLCAARTSPRGVRSVLVRCGSLVRRRARARGKTLVSQALWAELTLPLKRLWSRALTRRKRDVRFRGGDPRVCRNVARRNDAVQGVHVPLMGVCWVLLCMHRECCAMEKCAANAALGSAREPDGGFDCASSVVLFRSRRVGVRAGVSEKRLAHISLCRRKSDSGTIAALAARTESRRSSEYIYFPRTRPCLARGQWSPPSTEQRPN